MATTSRGYPLADISAAADIEVAVNPGLQAVDADVTALVAMLGALLPVGAGIPWYAVGDPPVVGGVTLLIADGRLIDRTTYPAFYTKVGSGPGVGQPGYHVHNGGVDPGADKVRIPDERGRVGVGADNGGTAQGAAGRLPNSLRALGQAAGEERHTLTVAEMPSHGHTGAQDAHVHTYHNNEGGNNTRDQWLGITNVAASSSGYPVGGGASRWGSVGMDAAQPGVYVYANGSGGAHNVMQPYLVRHVLVRVK